MGRAFAHWEDAGRFPPPGVMETGGADVVE